MCVFPEVKFLLFGGIHQQEDGWSGRGDRHAWTDINGKIVGRVVMWGRIVTRACGCGVWHHVPWSETGSLLAFRFARASHGASPIALRLVNVPFYTGKQELGLLKEVFGIFDKDQSGSIDADELQEAFHQMGMSTADAGEGISILGVCVLHTAAQLLGGVNLITGGSPRGAVRN